MFSCQLDFDSGRNQTLCVDTDSSAERMVELDSSYAMGHQRLGWGESAVLLGYITCGWATPHVHAAVTSSSVEASQSTRPLHLFRKGGGTGRGILHQKLRPACGTPYQSS